MDRHGFARQVDEFFAKRPCEDAQSAMLAILKFYMYVETIATSAEAMEVGSDAWSRNVYMIQQTMSRTPLCHFWKALALNDSVIIRSCAKGNLSESTGDFYGDREIGIIAHANLRLMFNERVVAEVKEEISNSESIKEAYVLWNISTMGDFTPMFSQDETK